MYFAKQVFRLTLLVLLVGLHASPGYGQPSGLFDAFSAVQRVKMRMEIAETRDSTDPEATRRSQHVKSIEIRRDGPMLTWSLKDDAEINIGEPGQMALGFKQYAFHRPGERLFVMMDAESNSPVPMQMDLTSLYIAQDKVSRFLAATYPDDNLTFFGLGFLDGHDLMEVFVRPGTFVEKNGMLEVTSRTRFGEFFCVLDPNAGYLPRRVSLRQSGADINAGRRVDSIDMYGGGLWPKGGVERLELDITDISFDTFNGRHYITSWKLVSRTNGTW